MKNDATHPLRRIREDLEISQTDFSIMCGLTQPAISVIEIGRCDLRKEVLDVVGKLGYDKKQFKKEHAEYVEKRREFLLEKYGKN